MPALPKDQLFCAVRRVWVPAQPEEVVRQRLLSLMFNELAFPPSALIVERALHQMPHLSLMNWQCPDRRIDIAVFAKGIHPEHLLYPLLAIECKAVPLTQKTISQVTGYNHFLGAYFVAIANEKEIQTGCFNPKTNQYSFSPGLPSFASLMQAVLGSSLKLKPVISANDA